MVTPGDRLELRRIRQPGLQFLRAEGTRIYPLDDRCQRAVSQHADLRSADAVQASQLSLIEVAARSRRAR